jgi:hypothetical protein
MSKLKDHLIIEAEVTQTERRNANTNVMMFIRNIEDIIKETKQLRRETGPLYGKILKKAETDLKKVTAYMNDTLKLQMVKAGQMVKRK